MEDVLKSCHAPRGYEIWKSSRVFPTVHPQRGVERMGIPVTPSHSYFSPSIFTPSFPVVDPPSLQRSVPLCDFVLFFLCRSFLAFLSKVASQKEVSSIVLINNASMIRTRFLLSYFFSREIRRRSVCLYFLEEAALIASRNSMPQNSSLDSNNFTVCSV